LHSHAAVEVSVCRLLRRELDSAANGAPTDFFSAAVRSFHYSRPASSHDSESQPRNGRAHLSGELVVRIVALDAGRAKNRHAWTDEMQGAKSAQEIANQSQ